MKRKSIITLLVGAFSFGMLSTSCEDMLSPDSERHSYEVAQDTLYSYWGILKSMQNVGERYVILGECRGDLVSETGFVTDSIKAILDFDMNNATDGSCRYLQASDYYHIINSCNAYMASCDTARTTGTLKPYMMKEYAQVSAIRAWTYLQLVQVYGEVPFYTEPLLTTDAINNFMNNPSHQKANADNLADLLAPQLEKMAAVEKEYGFPQYQNYGYTNTVCHSEKMMIPINIILGDLYLTKGDKASCAKAAQAYYNFFNSRDGGVLTNNYKYIAYKGEGMDQPLYLNAGSNPFTEKGEWNRNQEAITAIPSSTNKLWGTVQRGVNELFGYASQISVRTNEDDTVTTASVSLFPQYDVKQLRASDGYMAQCKAMPFEYYITAGDINDAPLAQDDAVGDARRYWVQDVLQTYANGVTNTEKFVTKQNPGGSFTTVYPMIYRKSMVWLRYAEALNGAGYPSYAFAVLKNGLCNNDDWLPTQESEFAIKDTIFTSAHLTFTGKDSKNKDIILMDTVVVAPTEINYSTDFTAMVEAFVAQARIDNPELENSVGKVIANYEPKTYENFLPGDTKVVCYYIDKREMENSVGKDFLNFKTEYLYANSSSSDVMYRNSSVERGIHTTTYGNGKSGEGTQITTGIHYHGCGMLKYNETQSVFNYVDRVADKAKEYGYTLTKEDIYSGNYDDVIQKCVEDLIVDEEAMELAFEGTRFFDLMRVAHRRGDASYLASRVAKRNGDTNTALYSKLLDTKNWYFPLPAY